MDTECDSAIDSLPNEVLLKIFRSLSLKQLLTAERVCVRWKAMVKVRFATTKSLELFGDQGLTEKVKRYGSSVKCVKLSHIGYNENSIDWMAEIVNAFPNLLNIDLCYTHLRRESLNDLPVKCCKLTTFSLYACRISDADMGIVFKAFPALKTLDLGHHAMPIGECFRELGSNVEDLSLTCVKISHAGYLHIFSRCTNLQTLKIDHGFHCDAHDFHKFCEKSPLKKLMIRSSKTSKEVFLAISRLSLLEQLQLYSCPAVDSEVLIRISLGCPNLTFVYLSGLPRVCDRGVKAFAQCRSLRNFCCCIEMVTDESLFELAKAVQQLETLVFSKSEITDRGLSAILAQCPHLEHLHVHYCIGVGDSTVDAAIEAVESRARSLSATLSQPHRAKCTLIVPRSKSVETRGCLLHLRMSDQAHFLNRYKDGFSHPLLHLQLH